MTICILFRNVVRKFWSFVFLLYFHTGCCWGIGFLGMDGVDRSTGCKESEGREREAALQLEENLIILHTATISGFLFFPLAPSSLGLVWLESRHHSQMTLDSSFTLPLPLLPPFERSWWLTRKQNQTLFLVAAFQRASIHTCVFLRTQYEKTSYLCIELVNRGMQYSIYSLLYEQGAQVYIRGWASETRKESQDIFWLFTAHNW